MKERLHALGALAWSVIGSPGTLELCPRPISFRSLVVRLATIAFYNPQCSLGLYYRFINHVGHVVERLYSCSFFSRTTTALADSEYRRAREIVQSVFAVLLRCGQRPVVLFHA
jgi:hypothetical protein